MKLQVLLADDHALFRDGMRYVLQQLSEQVDIICAGDFAETLRQAENNPGIDLALLDLHMPGSDGVSSIRVFHDRYPALPLVVVSGSDQQAEIEWVMEYGAMGFISKTSSGKAMVSALRMVLDGGIYFPPQLLTQSSAQNRAFAARSTTASADDRNNQQINKFGLTKRQLQTLQHLSEGLSNKEIAFKMNLAEGTIKVHVAAAFQTLQVNSRMDAVRKAQKLGLFSLAREDRDAV
jgi:DNA-binding NarL/FixJ family response regulator